MSKKSRSLSSLQGGRNNRALALIVQELRLKYPLDNLLEYTGLSRRTYYYNIRRHEDKYEDLKASISTVFYENKGRYDYRRVHAALSADGIKQNPKLIRRPMKELGLKGITNSKRRKYSSYKGEFGRIAKNFYVKVLFGCSISKNGYRCY